MRPTSEAVGRRRATVALKESLRDLRNQLSLLNHQVSAHLALKDVDLDCLELIARHGPVSPSALARRAGLHPATMTGILDRLQKGGWIVRERDPDARRPPRGRGARGPRPQRRAVPAVRGDEHGDGRPLRRLQRRGAGADRRFPPPRDVGGQHGDG